MMVITSKMLLEEIHKECLKQKENVNETDLSIQKEVLEKLSDWKPDDCMIYGSEHLAFSSYKKLNPSIEEYVNSNLATCPECTHVYKKTEMLNNNTICEDCYQLKSEKLS